jgi:hypothetical protein
VEKDMAMAEGQSAVPAKDEHRVFVSYSHHDARHREALKQAAQRLEAAGLVSLWHDEQVAPGAPWAEEIRRTLEGSRLVLALLSPDFLASPWCVSELGRAFELRDRRLLDVVPIIVRQCDWRETPLGAIQALPAGGAPVESLPDQSAAWNEVVAGLERLLRGERVQPALPSRTDLVQRCSEQLEADRRLMLLAPWRDGLEELAQEIARKTHGDAITTLRVPAVDAMTPAEFYAELSGEPAVNSVHLFRRWLMKRSTQGAPGRHLVVLPYFGGPHELVVELGTCMRGVFEQTGTFSLLVFGRTCCAALLATKDHSLFSGILTEHVPGLDLAETQKLLLRLGADPIYGSAVHQATGGHPEWTALGALEARAGRMAGLAQYLADRKIFAVLHTRLIHLDSDHQGKAHAAHTLEKLLAGERVVRLQDVRDDLSYPEVRLYYDGVVVERDERTVFRCEAARLAAERALKVWRQAP